MSHQGVVKSFLPDRGFGFIKPDDGSKDIFFHIQSVQNSASPRVDQRVSFEIKGSDDGRQRAATVRLI
ncbi:cold-shock protein [Bradyrhizobium sp. RDM4]|uniref:cold-shock protein n=1 Tax=Bradyrhizobium sp. RDM4 TaxID=3378765 RepID=UPI0038FCC45B